jgi:hypothetical protein
MRGKCRAYLEHTSEEPNPIWDIMETLLIEAILTLSQRNEKELTKE